MSALQRLQEKIEQWKHDHDELRRQNADLKSQLAGVAGAHEANETLRHELESKVTQCETLEASLVSLRQELREKDEEIEKIIAQVESLLA